MFSRAIFILSVWMFCQALTPRQEQESGAGSEKAGAPEYQVQSYSTLRELRVVDGDGQLVKGLTREEFLVLESGQARPIQYFEELDLSPLSLGVLLDIGSSSNEKQILVAKAAVFELLHQLDPADELLIGVYNEDIHFLSDLTTDRLELLRALENVSPGGRASFFSKLTNVFASSGHTGWAVDQTLMRMKACRHINKVLLVFSAAFGSIGPATQEHLRFADSKLFAVTWKNRVGDTLNFYGDKAAGKRAIGESGGIAFEGQSILEKIESLLDALKSFYLIAYEPLDLETEGEQEDLEISIPDCPEFKVHTFRRLTTGHAVY